MERSEPKAGTQHPHLSTLVRSIEGMHLFRGVLKDDIGSGFVELLRGLASEGGSATRRGLLEGYGRLFSLLAAEVEMSRSAMVGDGWQNHLLSRLLADDNPFSRKAQVDPESMGESLREAARRDLRVLQELYRLDAGAVLSLMRDSVGDERDRLVPWDALRPVVAESQNGALTIWRMKNLLAESGDWGLRLDDLAHHYSSAGSGIFARYRAFRWAKGEGGGKLEGIADPDLVNLDELVEYERERALLIQNTEQFVRGYPANNALLYGERGTGKSSTIKALLPRFGDRGLRLIEVPKGMLGDFPRILALLRGRKERFVLFVDDLSFDERETAYKELKAALEGSVEARPSNVVVYATSNRRHLVQERFSDREGSNAEIRGWDTHQEKLSLADRFGITLVFVAPDQPIFLKIVESLARRRSLDIDDAELKRRAIEWASQQGGFSGRCARQFVDHLTGELGVAASAN
ncbi:MAG TPA: ATP-binding protein [Chloroflexota bacterium]|nr:ATP-binding protein [Chloroflexota bacterium]